LVLVAGAVEAAAVFEPDVLESLELLAALADEVELELLDPHAASASTSGSASATASARDGRCGVRFGIWPLPIDPDPAVRRQ